MLKWQRTAWLGEIDYVQGAGQAERPAVQVPGQRRPVDQLQHQVGRIGRSGLAVVIDLGDVRVRERAGLLGLGPEPGQAVRLAGVLRVQQFDRDGAAQREVGATPHLAHATGRYACIEPVSPVQHLSRLSHTAAATRARPSYPGLARPVRAGRFSADWTPRWPGTPECRPPGSRAGNRSWPGTGPGRPPGARR